MSEYHVLALKAFIDLMSLKNYSEKTIKTYRNWFLLFLKNFPERKPSTISKEEIMKFLIEYREKEKWSASAQNQMISAIKMFYEKLLKKPEEFYDLPRAKQPQQLPTVLSEEEILSIINATNNLKHRTILCLVYAGGFRISEVVKLKINDIDSKRMVINIRAAKGKKDRTVMMGEKLLKLLREYFKKYKPKIWMFEGAKGGQYSERSISKFFQECKKKANVKKEGGIHSLRHSFATHLHEAGTDILNIKELLGHNNLRTTLGYTHVSKKSIGKIQSPFDRLGE